MNLRPHLALYGLLGITMLGTLPIGCDASTTSDAATGHDAASLESGVDASLAVDAPTLDLDAYLGDDAYTGDDATPGVDAARELDATSAPDAVALDAGMLDSGAVVLADAGRDAGSDAGRDASVGSDAGPAPGYDVFILAGQSNMVGRGSPDLDPVLDAAHPQIFQWGRFDGNDGVIIPASARLDHNDMALRTRVGMGLSFAKAYRAAQAVPRPILLVPTARGGTGFAANEWNPGDPLFEDTVARANAAMASDPGNRLVAILWHQGENDVVAGYGTAQYAAAVDRLIYRLRARVTGASSAPVILGQFSPDWTTSATAVLAAIDATPSRVPFTAVAPSAGLSGNPPMDGIHFNAASQRTYGQRYFAALATALANTPTVSLRGAPTGLTATPGGSSVDLSWTAPAAGGGTILGYRVEWRPTAGGSWSSTYVAASPTTITGLSPSTSHSFRVLAQNEAGLGAAATLSATTLAAGTPPTPALFFTFDSGSAVNTGSVGAAGNGTATAGVSFVSDATRGLVANVTRPTGVITVARPLAHAAYSITAWVEFASATGSANIVSSTNGGTTAGAHYFFRTGSSPFVVGGAHVSATRIVEEATAVPVSTWVHLSLTYDGAGTGTMRLYRAGVEVDSATGVTALAAPMPALFLGAASATGASGMEGRLDDVRIYDRALTAGEVSDVFAADSP